MNNFCKELVREKAEILWSALAIPAKLDFDLLKLMRESGCVQLRFGVESGGSELLKNINKNTTSTEMSQVLKDTHNAGIYTYVTLINGLPMEKENDIFGTKSFLYKNRKYIDSATICDYGELGHFGINVLENLLKTGKNMQASQEIRSTGRLLRSYAKRIGLNEIDIIDDFLSKID